MSHMNRNTGKFSSLARSHFQSRKSKANNTRPPLTHFLSLPIGHHVSLQQSISSFMDTLLGMSPTLPGLDRSIVIPPRRLHLTLGVMSLGDSEVPAESSSNYTSGKTLQEALTLLSSLKPQITQMLSGMRLCVPLRLMDIMPPDGDDPDKAHVLWLGPLLETEDAQRLLRVGKMINKTFVEAGFITDRRPLKLHCTVLNTTYRKPKRRSREPFSYKSLLMSPATRAVFSEPLVDSSGPRQPVKVNFGTWDVDEIQICKMGSYGLQGEYVSCGGVSLE